MIISTALTIAGFSLTALTLIIRAYRTAKKNVGMWAHTLLNNHIHGIEVAAKSSSEAAQASSNAIVSLAGYHKDMLSSQFQIAKNIETMSQDFRAHVKDDERIQSEIRVDFKQHEIVSASDRANILRGIEAIREKLD